jgi:hypothetical protein|tara:strand:+ start:140 stop:460 length:321 start_codon:yes stop_codon:yes gene_type:complete
MEYSFPTDLHAIAFKYYDHLKRGRNDIEFILWKINENNLEDYVKIYLNSSQFNRNLNIRNFWNQTKDEEDPSLTGTQEDVLIFILNMYCCQKNKQKRAMKLKRGAV